jgi:hypothetical protein
MYTALPLNLFAGDIRLDEHHYETGWAWLLTPVKNWYTTVDVKSGTSPWYAAHYGSGDHYIDFRVIGCYLLVLLGLFGFSIWVSRRSKSVAYGAPFIEVISGSGPLLYSLWHPRYGSKVVAITTIVCCLVAVTNCLAIRRLYRIGEVRS